MKHSNTPSMSTIRLLFAIATLNGLCIRQTDIKTAFLNAELKESIFMHRPKGFVEAPGKVWQRKKSLYGLKQAPREWFLKFSSSLKQIGLTQSTFDACVFHGKQQMIIVVFYVDDVLIMSQNPSAADRIIAKLKQEYELQEL